MTRATRLALSWLSIVATGACTEPRARSTAAAPAPKLEARVEVSDTLPAVGASVEVRVRLVGRTAARVASFVDRITYDTLGLRYLDEVSLGDGAMRATNPTPGLIRSAGVHAAGFESGVLGAYRFEVRRPEALASLRLTIDALHAVDHSDATPMLSLARTVVEWP